MECPDCKDYQLQSVLSKQGLEVDCCGNCQGVWFDRGEIYFLAIRPEIASKRLKVSGLRNKISPKTNTAMTAINYPEGIEIFVCESGGIWIEGKQINKFKGSDDNVLLDLAFLGAYDDMDPGFSMDGNLDSNMGGANSGSGSKRGLSKAEKVKMVMLLSLSILLVLLFLRPGF